MASIEKWTTGYRVRWRDPGGGGRSRTAPNLQTARKIKLAVEQAVAQGLGWQSRGVGEDPSLKAVLTDFIREYDRVYRPATVRRHASCLDMFSTWLAGAGRGTAPSVLSKALLADFYEYLLVTGRHGHTRTPGSAQKIVASVEIFWKWAYEQDDYEESIPRPRRLPFARQPRTPTIAPTWEEMDRCVSACSGWHRQLAILLRFTGLRVQQAMLLKWADFDLGAHTLRVRGELGKTSQERAGRIVPISQYLVDELKAMAPVTKRKGFVVPCGRKADGPRAREARARDMGRAWKRAGVREEAWKQRPHHAYRKGVRSGLKRLGADDMAVEFLLGHSLGIAGVYTDPDAMPLRDAVERIPPLTQMGEVVEFDSVTGQGS
jgi:integrase